MLPVPSTACALSSSSISAKDFAVLGKQTSSLLGGQYKRLRHDKPILPSFCAKRRAVLSFTTNWAGFYEQIVMEDCHHVTHFPVFISNAAVIPGAVIYKSDSKTLNILAVQGKLEFVDALVKIGAVDVM